MVRLRGALAYDVVYRDEAFRDESFHDEAYHYDEV